MLTKIHQEHSQTWNKGIIKIVNNIRNINKELAIQPNNISEQMESFEKTDSFVKGTLMQIWKSSNIFAFIWK